MTPTALLIVCIVCIAACVYLGNKFNINIGVLALPVAYIISVFFLGNSTKETVAFWPTSTMFTVISLCLFFGYVNESGAASKIANLLLYKTRSHPAAMPFTIMLIAVVLTGTGANPFAVAAICCPLIFNICARTGKNAILGFAMVTCGTNMMAYLPWSSAWAVQTGVIESGELAAGASQYMYGVMVGYICFFLLCGILMYISLKGPRYMSVDTELKAPEPFTRKEKLAIAFVIAFIAVIIIPTALGTILRNKTISGFARRLDVGFVATVFAALSALCRLGDTKAVIGKQVPWTTIIMICGVAMLINVAANGGAIEVVGDWIGSAIPKALIGPALFIVGGILSMFVSTNNVAIPTLFAIVPAIAAASGIAPTLMYVCIAVGCSSTGCFPFSGSGSFALAVCQDEKMSAQLFKDQMKMAAFQLCIGIVISLVLSIIL